MKHKKLFQFMTCFVFFLSSLFYCDSAISQSQNIDSFEPGTSFRWDGSAPLGFPKFAGPLPIDESRKKWDANAKTFAKSSMDFLPPAVRPAIANGYIKACEIKAQKMGSPTITQIIVAEVFAELARGAGMPENVMKNLPKTMADLDRQKIEVPDKELKEVYRRPPSK